MNRAEVIKELEQDIKAKEEEGKALQKKLNDLELTRMAIAEFKAKQRNLSDAGQARDIEIASAFSDNPAHFSEGASHDIKKEIQALQGKADPQGLSTASAGSVAWALYQEIRKKDSVLLELEAKEAQLKKERSKIEYWDEFERLTSDANWVNQRLDYLNKELNQAKTSNTFVRQFGKETAQSDRANAKAKLCAEANDKLERLIRAKLGMKK